MFFSACHILWNNCPQFIVRLKYSPLWYYWCCVLCMWRLTLSWLCRVHVHVNKLMHYSWHYLIIVFVSFCLRVWVNICKFSVAIASLVHNLYTKLCLCKNITVMVWIVFAEGCKHTHCMSYTLVKHFPYTPSCTLDINFTLQSKQNLI